MDPNFTTFMTLDKNCSDEYGITAAILYASSLSLIMTTALIANLTALVTILRVQSLRQTPHNMLILNLTIVDLGRASLVMPFSLKSVLDEGQYLEDHLLACKIIGFFHVFFDLINYLTIAFIAVDRVIVVTSCARCRISDWTRVRTMVVFAYLLSGLLAVTPTFELGGTSIVYNNSWRVCTADLDMFETIIVAFMIGSVLPIMIICYTIIAVLLWKRDRKLTRRRRHGLRATINTKSISRPLPTSPVGLRKVTFDMTCTLSSGEALKSENENPQTKSLSRKRSVPNPCSVIGQLDQSQNIAMVPESENSKVETDEVAIPRRRKKPNAGDRNARNFAALHDSHLSTTMRPTSGNENNKSSRHGLGARLSALLNFKGDSESKEDIDVEHENCVIKGFKSANGTGFIPGSSISVDIDKSSPYRTVIETKNRRLSNLFGSLKRGIVGIGQFGKEDDYDDDDDHDDDDPTCDIDSEPSYTVTTYSMSPSTVEAAGPDKVSEDVGDVVRPPRVRKRTRKTKLEKLRNMRQRRVALTGVLLVCCNMVFSLPLGVWRFVDCPPDWYGVLAVWLSYCVTIADPMVYAFMNRRVKKELRMYRKTAAACLSCRR